jgi:hypothetical protein
MTYPASNSFSCSLNSDIVTLTLAHIVGMQCVLLCRKEGDQGQGIFTCLSLTVRVAVRRFRNPIICSFFCFRVFSLFFKMELVHIFSFLVLVVYLVFIFLSYNLHNFTLFYCLYLHMSSIYHVNVCNAFISKF